MASYVRLTVSLIGYRFKIVICENDSFNNLTLPITITISNFCYFHFRLERRRLKDGVTAEKLTEVEDEIDFTSCTGSLEAFLHD